MVRIIFVFTRGLLNSTDTLTMSAGLLPYAQDSDLTEISTVSQNPIFGDIMDLIRYVSIMAVTSESYALIPYVFC